MNRKHKAIIAEDVLDNEATQIKVKGLKPFHTFFAGDLVQFPALEHEVRRSGEYSRAHYGEYVKVQVFRCMGEDCSADEHGNMTIQFAVPLHFDGEYSNITRSVVRGQEVILLDLRDAEETVVFSNNNNIPSGKLKLSSDPFNGE